MFYYSSFLIIIQKRKQQIKKNHKTFRLRSNLSINNNKQQYHMKLSSSLGQVINDFHNALHLPHLPLQAFKDNRQSANRYDLTICIGKCILAHWQTVRSCSAFSPWSQSRWTKATLQPVPPLPWPHQPMTIMMADIGFTLVAHRGPDSSPAAVWYVCGTSRNRKNHTRIHVWSWCSAFNFPHGLAAIGKEAWMKREIHNARRDGPDV